MVRVVYADEDGDNDADDDGARKGRGNGRNRHKESIWEEVHEVSANLMLVLIFLHIAGVIVSSRLHRENLVKTIITGRKKVLPDA